MNSRLNYLIVHGTYGYPEENWFPWLKNKLSANANVVVPKFPTPEGQTLASWLTIADAAIKNWTPDSTVLIGHSAGAVLVLRMAEKAKKPFRAVYPVCPFAQPLNLPQFDPLLSSFVEPPFDWQAVQRGAKTITCFAGDDDPYVPLGYSDKVARPAGAALIVIKKGGHLNEAAGYLEFPRLLEEIIQA